MAYGGTPHPSPARCAQGLDLGAPSFHQGRADTRHPPAFSVVVSERLRDVENALCVNPAMRTGRRHGRGGIPSPVHAAHPGAKRRFRQMTFSTGADVETEREKRGERAALPPAGRCDPPRASFPSYMVQVPTWTQNGLVWACTRPERRRELEPRGGVTPPTLKATPAPSCRYPPEGQDHPPKSARVGGKTARAFKL